MAETTADKTAEKKRTPAEDAAILKEARERFKLSAELEDDYRKAALEDKRFAAGAHWPEKIKAARESDGRPCLTIDRLTPQVKQVTNQQRAMRPSAQVHPVDDGADVDTAEVLQGIIRHIEARSDADDAYDQAGRDQTIIGRGWFRILTEYCDDKTLNQEIRIERVRNPFTIYPDPHAKKRDYSDGRFLLAVEDVPEADFKRLYPGAKHATLAEFQSIGDDKQYWCDDKTIRVAEYWRVEVDTADLAVGGRTRKVERRKVLCDKISGLEVLEPYAWAGKYIPFVPVIGEEVDLEGKVDYRGMVRTAKDPQRMFNFWKSATTEMIALAPKAPYVMAEGQDEGFEEMWEQANTRNFSSLKYKPTTIGDKLAPPPQRSVAEPPIQALLASTQGAENDLRAVTGFFDVNQHEGAEQSGVAIRARQQQGEHGNADYIDGLARGIRYGARILIDLAPKIYDVPRVLRITGKDGQQRSVMVHAGQAPAVDPQTGQPAVPEGIEGLYDLGLGEYDVTVSVGPSQLSARADFVDQMGPILQAHPELFAMIGDLYVEHMDFSGAKPIAERLKKMLPPQLQDQPDMADIPPAAQAQMAQMQQQMQQMQQALQQAQQAVEGKQIEAASKERIARFEGETKVKLAEIEAETHRRRAAVEMASAQQKIDSDQAIAAQRANVELAKSATSAGVEVAKQAHEHAHGVASQGREHQHAADMMPRDEAA